MKRISNLVLWSLLLYLIVLSQTARAQGGDEGLITSLSPTLHFTHLTVDDGLVQNSIEAILQDRQGFIWIGTPAGLSRYDGYRILVVDDKWTNRQLLIKLLNPLGFDLREAQNGQEALQVWEEFEPHLIWMDMRMPVMDGFEATRRIKATTKGQATAIIALTASSFEEERAILLTADCDDFVRKPFREVEIFEMMSKHIGTRYIYEETNFEEYLPEARPQPLLENLRAEINTLPARLLDQLIEGTELGDMEVIDQALTSISHHQPLLAEALSQLAHNFEYDKMLNLIQGVTHEPEKINFGG